MTFEVSLPHGELACVKWTVICKPINYTTEHTSHVNYGCCKKIKTIKGSEKPINQMSSAALTGISSWRTRMSSVKGSREARYSRSVWNRIVLSQQGKNRFMKVGA